MTDTMMIVFGVLSTIFVGYVAISLILGIIMSANYIYRSFYEGFREMIAKYRESKDE